MYIKSFLLGVLYGVMPAIVCAGVSTTSSSSTGSGVVSTSSSSSSSHAIEKISSKVLLTEAIKQAFLATQKEYHPGLASIIAEYVPNTLIMPYHLITIRPSLPIAALAPRFYLGYPQGKFTLCNSLIDHEFFNQGFNQGMILVATGFRVKFYMEEVYLDYRWDQDAQTLQKSGHNSVWDVVKEGPVVALCISTEKPEITVPLVDGSLLHVWVADHDPIKGGTLLEWYREEPARPVTQWNLATLLERTVIKPAETAQKISSSSSSSATH